MRLIRRSGSKNERRNKEETMLHGCMKKEQRETVMHEAKLMREAAENYLLAPMAVRKYYLSLYCGLLKKYGEQLREKGLSDMLDYHMGPISLYQDAGSIFSRLSNSLTALAGERPEEEKDGQVIWL